MGEPAEDLAERIVERLLAAGLVRETDAAGVRERIARGEATEADWLGWVKAAAEEPGGE